MISEAFSPNLDPRWRRHLRGGGALELKERRLRLLIRDIREHEYSDAQIDDHKGLPRGKFLWNPPLTMTVRARFSHSADGLKGTAGFGFWNDPFLMTGRRMPTLPRAIWFFFASPPSNMRLDSQVPGYGWKAATIDVLRWSFFLFMFAAPFAVPLMNLRKLYPVLWPFAQRLLNVSEALVPSEMTEWHTYVLKWGCTRARFFVDGDLLMDCRTPPRGPLGFVMWLDNQYAIVTPWGRLGSGLLAGPGEQWLEVDRLLIQPGTF
jgi:hypothetical protein